MPLNLGQPVPAHRADNFRAQEGPFKSYFSLLHGANGFLLVDGHQGHGPHHEGVLEV